MLDGWGGEREGGRGGWGCGHRIFVGFHACVCVCLCVCVCGAVYVCVVMFNAANKFGMMFSPSVVDDLF